MDASPTRMMIARKGSTLRTDFYNGLRHLQTFAVTFADVAFRADSSTRIAEALGSARHREPRGPYGTAAKNKNTAKMTRCTMP